MATAEQAFLKYLEKLDAVSHLEIVGEYWEDETDPATSEETDILHVFGRTPAIPHIHYYRRLICGDVWTPWEKVPVDIQGDDLIPVVYNRRLYLFWPVFTKKPKEGSASGQGESASQEQHWEIQMAWSEYRNGQWSAKKLSRESLDTPDVSEQNLSQEDTFSFKALILNQGLPSQVLVIRCYKQAGSSPPVTSPTTMIPFAEFRFKECSDDLLKSDRVDGGIPMLVPVDTDVKDMMFVQRDQPSSRRFYMLAPDLADPSKQQDLETLDFTPTTFRVLPPHQYTQFLLQAPFFYEDLRRTYFVRPEPIFDSIQVLTKAAVACPLYDKNLLDSSELITLPVPDDPAILSSGDRNPAPQLARVAAPALARAASASTAIAGVPLALATGVSDSTTRSVPLVSGDRRAPVARTTWANGESTVTLARANDGSMVNFHPPYQISGYDLRFATHYHPHVCNFVKALNRGGIPGLLRLENEIVVAPIHFYTTTISEREDSLASLGYVTEGNECYVFYSEPPGTTPLLRLNNSQTGDCIYTISTTELPSGYKSEGAQCYVFAFPSQGTVPLYRLFNPQSGYHFYTTSPAESDSAIMNAGYVSEGIACYVFSSNVQGTIPLYRLARTLFWLQYAPTDHVNKPYPTEDVDFRFSGAYSLYNWELFFHIPLLLATRLSENQRFEEAQKWFHYIFNPTDSSLDLPPRRYWKFLPFYVNTEQDRIQDLLLLLNYPGNDPETLERRHQVEKQVEGWRKHPFSPHLIARLRPIAYQKNVVMKYIDNLIAWGDQLFRQNTIESINEATQLYVLAYEILGPRPERLPERKSAQQYTYNELVTLGLDDFSNALVQLENQFPLSGSSEASSGANGSALSGLGTLYFCIPQNDKLLKYWDTVADRLFKIRHCMNIEGIIQKLPLFEPPIDPALLVQAAALGVDPTSALNDIQAATPHYRFTYMLQKAFEFCADVKSLGAALLTALEKKDAEELALLRAMHERNILQMVEDIKKGQADEAVSALEGLNKSLELAKIREDYYTILLALPTFSIPGSGIIGPDKSISLPLPMNEFELAHLALVGASLVVQVEQVESEIAAGILHLIPETKVGPDVGATYGGSNIANGIQAFGGALGIIAAMLGTAGAVIATLGGYKRRAEDWDFQKRLAAKEQEQINQQIAAANIRLDIARRELQIHQQQMEDAQQVQDFLSRKYTNQQLYDWMVSETSAIFFQTYQMAYDLAKRTEKAFRFERGLTNSDFIHFGYWDSLRKGLLSGERLHLDLRRLELAYCDQNKRDYEITKHISLMLCDPMALISLKETGLCELFLSEALFNADYPGHFMRCIESVSLTLPCIVGPYTSVNCTLTLLSDKIRIESTPTNPYEEIAADDGQPDARFVTNFAATQSIATSSAKDDTGLFNLNFRDERYNPFERAGVISRWRIDLPKDTNAFDFNTITDVVLHLKYTARDGGNTLAAAARKAMQDAAEPIPQVRLFSSKHEFPTEWYRFLHPKDAEDGQTFGFDLTQDRFPFQLRGRSIEISAVDLYLKFRDITDRNTYTKDVTDPTPSGDYRDGTALEVSLKSPNGVTARPESLKSDTSLLVGLPHAALDLANQPGGLGSWSLQAKDADIQQISPTLWQKVTVNGGDHYRLKSEVIEDIFMVCRYSSSK